jgi:hypothetical protein
MEKSLCRCEQVIKYKVDLTLEQQRNSEGLFDLI